MAPIHLTRDDARRIAIRAQWLDAPRPTDLLELIDRLTFLQIDPTAAIAPSADLVAWSRLGSAYRPTDLQHELEVERSLFEHDALIRPMADLRLFLAEMQAPPVWAKARDWLAANDRFRRDILERLRQDGPLLSRDIADTSTVPWPSSGWTNDRNVTQMLEILARHGEIAISARVGRQRLWDLAERVYPSGVEAMPAEEAARIRGERRLRSLGIARARGTAVPVDANIVGEAGEPATVEGTKGTWRVDPGQLDRLGEPFQGRTALLSPFDRLTYDRKRALELFDFEYTLEMYKPESKRRWGFFALPILHGDRLVGKLDANADHKSSTFRVRAIHRDVPFTGEMATAVDAEIEALALWLGLDVIDRPAEPGSRVASSTARP